MVIPMATFSEVERSLLDAVMALFEFEAGFAVLVNVGKDCEGAIELVATAGAPRNGEIWAGAPVSGVDL